MNLLYIGTGIGIIIGIVGMGLYGAYLEVEELRQPWHEQEGTNWTAYIRGVTAERDYMVCTLSLYPIRCHSDFPGWYLEKLEDRKSFYLNEEYSAARFLMADNLSPEPEHSMYAFSWNKYREDVNLFIGYDPWMDSEFIMCKEPKDSRCNLVYEEVE